MSSKPYIRQIRRYSWFFRQPRYMRYMAREVSSFFIGVHTLILVVGLKRLAQGPEAFQAFLDALRGPWGVLFCLAALAFSVYHSLGWFGTTPQAMPIQRGEEFVPPKLILSVQYAVWAVVSLIVLIMGI